MWDNHTFWVVRMSLPACVSSAAAIKGSKPAIQHGADIEISNHNSRYLHTQARTSHKPGWKQTMHLFSDPTSETPLYCSDIKFRVWLAGLKSTLKEGVRGK